MKIRDGFVSNSSSSSFVIHNNGHKEVLLTELVKEYCDRLMAQAKRNETSFCRGATEMVVSDEFEDTDLHYFLSSMEYRQVLNDIAIVNNGRSKA